MCIIFQIVFQIRAIVATKLAAVRSAMELAIQAGITTAVLGEAKPGEFLPPPDGPEWTTWVDGLKTKDTGKVIKVRRSWRSYRAHSRAAHRGAGART